MSNFNYMQKAVALDNRLEEVLSSHQEEPAPKVSYLAGWATKPSIAAEIDAVRGKTAAIDFNIARVEERLDLLAAERDGARDAMHEALKVAAEAYRDELEEEAATAAHIRTLRDR